MSRKSTDREAAETTLELIIKFIYEANNTVDDMPVYFDPDLMPYISLMEYKSDSRDKCIDVPAVANYRTKASKDAAVLLRYRGDITEVEYAAMLLSCDRPSIDNGFALALAQHSNKTKELEEAVSLLDSARISGISGEEWPTSVLEEDEHPCVYKILFLHYEVGKDLREAMLSVLEHRGHRYCNAVNAGLEELMRQDEDEPVEDVEGEEEEYAEEPDVQDLDAAGDSLGEEVEVEDDVDCPKFPCTEEDTDEE